MNILEDIKKGDDIRIVANDDWKNLFGVVCEKSEDLVRIFCKQRPTYLYDVGLWNKDSIVKMNILEALEKGDIVQIVANDSWKGLPGIVHKKTKDVLTIFCNQMPLERYYVGPWNKDDIVTFDKSSYLNNC